MKVRTRVSFLVDLNDEAVEAFKNAHDMPDEHIYGPAFWKSSHKVAALVRSTMEAAAEASLQEKLYEGRKTLEKHRDAGGYDEEDDSTDSP